MKKQFKLLNYVSIIVLLFVLTSCSLFEQSTNNKITNNIVNNVVEYKTMSIEEFQNALEIAVERVQDAVIGITTKEVIKKGFSTTEENISIGSGVIYKREAILYNKNLGEVEENIKTYKYYVITNRHVIEKKDESKNYAYYAYLGPEDIELKATLIGYDSKVDIALITFEHTRFIDPVIFGTSKDITKGSFALAIGNPDGYNYYGSATFGIISGPLRYISDDTDGDGIADFYAEYIQHDVAINPGNSGGGLFNIYGELIGINTLKLVNEKIDNMGFAIPSDVAQIIVKDYLEKNIPITRPRLGVIGIEVRSLTPSVIEAKELQEIPNIYSGETPYGIYIKGVKDGETNIPGITPGGSMDGSGIQEDDIILTFDDIKITRTYVLTAKLNSLTDYKIGDRVKITYYSRSSKTIKTVNIILRSIS